MRAAPRFQETRPQHLLSAPPWHQYSHHIRMLPERLEVLATDLVVPTGGSVLDYGCADMPYRYLFPADIDFVGADLDGNPKAALHLNPDGTIPIDPESFDVVLSTQVLEHVEDPGLYLSECFRVLRPGGRMLLSTHGVFVYHPDPEDYWRWTCAGLRRAVTDAGFVVERFEGIIGLAASGLQLTQDALYWRASRRLQPAIALVMQALVRLADRLETQRGRELNAQVFALIAAKPRS